MPSFEPKTSDLPAKFRERRIAECGEMFAGKLRDWLTSGKLSLYLHGPTGARKTSIAIAVLIEFRRMLRSGELESLPGVHDLTKGGLFLPVYEAARTFRDFGDEQRRDTIARWRCIDLLIIDDIGKHRSTPHVIEQFLHLLHERDDNGRRTIITANITPDELGKLIDPATARRLDEGLVLRMGVGK